MFSGVRPGRIVPGYSIMGSYVDGSVLTSSSGPKYPEPGGGRINTRVVGRLPTAAVVCWWRRNAVEKAKHSESRLDANNITGNNRVPCFMRDLPCSVILQSDVNARQAEYDYVYW